MKLQDMQFLAALRLAQQFLTANSSTFASVTGTGARKELDAAIIAIAALSEEQDSHRINVTGQRMHEFRLAAAFRRKFLRPIVEIAKAKLPNEAALANVKLPVAGSNTTKLVQLGRAVADAVQPFAPVFIEAGLPQDFIAQLQTAGDEVITAVTRKGTHRAGRHGATTSIEAEVRKARHAVRILDSLVKAAVQLEEPLVSEWRSAVKVIRGRALPPVTSPAPVAAPAPATTPNPAAEAPKPQAA